VDVIPKPEDVRDLGVLFANGWALAAFFAITGYGGMGLLFVALRASMREHIADLKGSKSSCARATPSCASWATPSRPCRPAPGSPSSRPCSGAWRSCSALEAERRGRRR
jgi:hypothetical protein